jgi:hypothetical protein
MKAVERRRAIAQQRAMDVRAGALGLTPDEYRAALMVACITWSTRRPWRWLPQPLRGWTFEAFGGRFAGRIAAGWKDGGHGNG